MSLHRRRVQRQPRARRLGRGAPAGSGTEKELYGGDPLTTNNRMELTAAIQALEALNGPATVDPVHRQQVPARRDHQVDLHGWQRNGWLTFGQEARQERRPVAQADRGDEPPRGHLAVGEGSRGRSGQRTTAAARRRGGWRLPPLVQPVHRGDMHEASITGQLCTIWVWWQKCTRSGRSEWIRRTDSRQAGTSLASPAGSSVAGRVRRTAAGCRRHRRSAGRTRRGRRAPRRTGAPRCAQGVAITSRPGSASRVPVEQLEPRAGEVEPVVELRRLAPHPAQLGAPARRTARA